MTTNKLTRGDGSKSLDGQGNAVFVNLAYRFTCGWPGPDTTIVLVKEVNEDDSVTCFDVYQKIEVKTKSTELFRPLRSPWRQDEIKAIRDVGGDE